jgi:hypothetical protein
MDRRRHESVTEAVHRQQRGVTGGVPVVVNERGPSHGGAGRRLHRKDLDRSAVDLFEQIGEREAGEVAPAAAAADDGGTGEVGAYSAGL